MHRAADARHRVVGMHNMIDRIISIFQRARPGNAGRGEPAAQHILRQHAVLQQMGDKNLHQRRALAMSGNDQRHG